MSLPEISKSNLLYYMQMESAILPFEFLQKINFPDFHADGFYNSTFRLHAGQ